MKVVTAGAEVVRVLDWKALPGAGTAGAARLLLEGRIAVGGLSPFFKERVGDLCLATSELVTNACKETPETPIRFRVVFRVRAVWLGVWDASDVLPPEPAPVDELDFAALDGLAEEQLVTGRGLAIVRELADTCGVTSTPPNGKWVWAEFACPLSRQDGPRGG
ncbi:MULTISPECIES: ATP-binding protein [Actinomadura]|uniref:ATP-binding protein n=1 Tax=Actinomadura yumaensis TaxID=111807 RepID=A0ABW2CEV2_9ACTN|nr:ATP-binding protein [Actinomadura sp. J1-007]MWK38091.1 hypothetical protein [Actinomadura sp. J1-007]